MALISFSSSVQPPSFQESIDRSRGEEVTFCTFSFFADAATCRAGTVLEISPRTARLDAGVVFTASSSSSRIMLKASGSRISSVMIDFRRDWFCFRIRRSESHSSSVCSLFTCGLVVVFAGDGCTAASFSAVDADGISYRNFLPPTLNTWFFARFSFDPRNSFVFLFDGPLSVTTTTGNSAFSACTTALHFFPATARTCTKAWNSATLARSTRMSHSGSVPMAQYGSSKAKRFQGVMPSERSTTRAPKGLLDMIGRERVGLGGDGGWL
mmetsp:Transcript_12606/g.31891  ORF Transcript_12606/g.31891 Transcript_12606/m.31891 type:complete len:268 (-) Transcript_12606:122-925(-)